jgi:hypothetical protein
MFELHQCSKHTEFYIGYLKFNVTSFGNAGCFKKSYAMAFQMLPCGECYENTYT